MEHGVPPAARVALPPGDGAAAAWAAARGARRWALLSQDARPFHLAVALTLTTLTLTLTPTLTLTLTLILSMRCYEPLFDGWEEAAPEARSSSSSSS